MGVNEQDELAEKMDIGRVRSHLNIDSFYTLDNDRIVRSANRFTNLFSGKVLYAVKANPFPSVLRSLIRGGIHGFDVASRKEIDDVRQLNNSLPCFYMNPVKSRKDIQHAYLDRDVRAFSVDHIEEVVKLKEILPVDDSDVTVFARLNSSNHAAVFELSSKFGASDSEVVDLCRFINDKTGWRVGLTFHLGSQSTDCNAFLLALEHINDLVRDSGIRCHCLDIGGGFPGHYCNSSSSDLDVYINRINEKIRTARFLSDLELYCEPGRALVHDSMSLFSRVLLRKGDKLYVSSGIYSGLLSAKKWLKFPTRCWRSGSEVLSDKKPFVIFGPTCDSLDKLGFTFDIPGDVQEGDLIEFENVGAYSLALQSDFNGLATSKVVEIS